MKTKIALPIVFTLLLFTSLSTSVLAQHFTLKTWTWKDYKMKFKAPNDMVVEENSSTAFKAYNNSITLDIYPRKGENLSDEAMGDAIVKWAQQESLSYSSYTSSGKQQPFFISDINGYWGCAIDGSKKGYPASMLLLVDPDFPEYSFYIWISYNEGYLDDAVQILRSFEPY